jgi:hypothetical protein
MTCAPQCPPKEAAPAPARQAPSERMELDAV